ncbi:hypothetical protein D8B23_02610 [Verminephrobacter aporrectodeae subsp. tuberculatae]|uniref:hypothetical protein n=1 Tax=Verminephrobacter aporrectodeae TaxID=1110389 RepID=UPI0022374A8F|nr:hypothetical protein [Verminephrobacter aporrectodeae]MCW5223479.1 hypothetical protein [Verminephrobacter aporrectodeae subsp. tuberculatae]MCW5288943.1 hypothetical protein [Verminephrobacter aporrectodeae subsp. tuberculatae]MCW8197335.1 hypothetical protein [Verminephrobacter aporrectodeae subsp. tuberculatae]MCW8208983.1 hypothetical protein [Verminephrobacter aporrectodeae subsp. tuberculatae]
MFDKILIAYRSEIACKRICRSLVMLRDQRLENPWRTSTGTSRCKARERACKSEKFSKGSP